MTNKCLKSVFLTFLDSYDRCRKGYVKYIFVLLFTTLLQSFLISASKSWNSAKISRKQDPFPGLWRIDIYIYVTFSIHNADISHFLSEYNSQHQMPYVAAFVLSSSSSQLECTLHCTACGTFILYISSIKRDNEIFRCFQRPMLLVPPKPIAAGNISSKSIVRCALCRISSVKKRLL